MADQRKILATFSINDTIRVRLTDAGRAHLLASPYRTKVEPDGTFEIQLWDFAHVFGPKLYMGAPTLIDGGQVEVLEDAYAMHLRLAEARSGS